MIDHAGVLKQRPHIPQSVPATQSIGHKRDDLRTRIYHYCIPDKCSDGFRKLNNDSSFDPENYTANRRADTTYHHRRRLPLARVGDTIACCRIPFGFPVCRWAARSIGNTSPDSNRMAICQQECLVVQVVFF